MYSHCNTIFKQLLSFLPRDDFNRFFGQHNADKGVRKLTTWNQLTALLYAQATGKQSLRDIEIGLNMHSNNWYHLGIKMIDADDHYRIYHKDGCCWAGQDAASMHAYFDTSAEFSACQKGIVDERKIAKMDYPVSMAIRRVASMPEDERKAFWSDCEKALEEHKRIPKSSMQKINLKGLRKWVFPTIKR